MSIDFLVQEDNYMMIGVHIHNFNIARGWLNIVKLSPTFYIGTAVKGSKNNIQYWNI